MRVEVSKKLSAAASSKEGEFDTSMTTAAPSRALASPSPVIVFTPVAGDAATASWPCSRSRVTTFDPMSPLPPITTTFMLCPFGLCQRLLLAVLSVWTPSHRVRRGRIRETPQSSPTATTGPARACYAGDVAPSNSCRAARSSRRELTPSFVKTLRRWYSTVRGLMKS